MLPKEYLEQHDFETIFKDLMQILLQYQPPNPWEFLSDCFRLVHKTKEAGGSLNYQSMFSELAKTRYGSEVITQESSQEKEKSAFEKRVVDTDMPLTNLSEDNLSEYDALPEIDQQLSAKFSQVKSRHKDLKNATRRGSVSAESILPDDEPRKKIIIPKSEEAKIRIEQSISNNLLFRNLEPDQRTDIVDAMFEKKVSKDEIIIKQGEEGDNFYVVDKGLFDIFVNNVKVIQIGPSGSFGELALMYNTPRAATVIATVPGILWGVDRVTFRHIITSIAFQKRKLYGTFLRTVPILSSLSKAEIAKICDALEPVTYNEGDVIIEQGSVADYFYIIESGEAVVTKVDEIGMEKEVSHLKAGDYFGELALLNDQPRAATVSAATYLKIGALSRDAFVRLLGPVVDILKRNTERYCGKN